MKARVIIEYDLLPGDRIVVRDREEQRWTACKTLLALPGSATVTVELLEVPLMPGHAAAAIRGVRDLPDIRQLQKPRGLSLQGDDLPCPSTPTAGPAE
jgi:hypothetical protein